MTSQLAPPVVLVHGWGGSFESTWQRSGFTALLEDAGLQVIGVDLLGHGTAPKPHDPEAYADLTERLLDALPDQPVDAIGFSLGAMTLLRLAIAQPHRFNRIVLAGVGANLFDRDEAGTRAIVAGLEAVAAGGDPSTLDNTVRLFTQYASQLARIDTGNRRHIVLCQPILQRPVHPEVARPDRKFANHQSRRIDPGILHVLWIDANVTDVRIGEGDNLLIIRRIS